MVRKFKPVYYYNAFKEHDVTEINKIIDYCQGLVIKDQNIADKNENNDSMRSAESYLAACNPMMDNFNEYEKYIIQKNYKELNPYYKRLKSEYNISYYEARKAKDYDIIKVLNNTLTNQEEELFNEAYREAVSYFMNVTHTKAFSNQKYERSMFNIYLINSAIHRYLNKIFHGYFNVDTYDKLKLKNGFISWGMDFFDDLPIQYQRRIYKTLNDLIRKKGSNDVFDQISAIFSLDSIEINKYFLAKKGSNTLSFYKTGINDQLDISNDTEVRYDNIVDQDPYWRSSYSDIVDKDFNIVQSKYISVDASIDIVNNNTNLAYLYSLIKQVKEESKDTHDTFKFKNTNISDQSINIYDGILALNVLILKRIGWTDKLSKNHSENTLSFNFTSDIRDQIQHMKDYVFRNKRELDDYPDIINFLSSVNIKNINHRNLITVDDIISEYNRSDIIKDQFKYIAEIYQGITGSNEMLYYINKNMIYDGMNYLWNQLSDNERPFNYSSVSHYTDFLRIFNKFIGHQINNKIINSSDLFLLAKEEENMMNELNIFVENMQDDDLDEIYMKYTDNITEESFNELVDEIEYSIERRINEGNYQEWQRLESYPVLHSFIFDIMRYDKYDIDEITLEDISDIMEYNLRMKKSIEDFSLNINDIYLRRESLKLHEQLFINNSNNKILDEFNSYSDYLKISNPGLYYFTIVQSNIYDHDSFDMDKEYRDRIFELVNSLDNHLNFQDNLFINNNFIGILSFIKNYIQILVTIFKSYTADIINTNLYYKLDSEFDNTINLIDSLQSSNIEQQETDKMNILDSFTINTTES